MTENKQISMAASAIALRGVRLFLNAGKAAADRPQTQAAQPAKSKRKEKKAVGTKPPQKVFEMLLKSSRFNKPEIEALYTMYRKLVASAQAAAPATAIGHSPKIDGIDQSTFRDVMHNTFDLVTEEAILERMWMTWERGAVGGEGALRFDSWVKGLSVLLRGNTEERITYCFKVYDLNNDGFITKDEMFLLLRNSLLKQPGDEDPDEGVRELVELVLKKLDVDKDGTVSMDDYRQAVDQEPLLLEAFGQCLPSKRHCTTFLKTLANK
ncbi:EF-hand calcium-binding domain-containing protein 1 [Trichoplusia ni]|uniref:EF-hand calcium-binding domain-containing protein 1 n=1 Tax=Trichoplusia ni TaxID=7111 RepID=A0A7E5WDN4_TRINI|nr:EF-hand calcium-binding domain-containing protein 1 [Trichoplusia ni]XP_026738789.1 EF-hand calcium-binding domain-containing protein 1 [Trichoplusia ni]